MRRAFVIALAGVAFAASAQAAPKADLMVVGRSAVLREPGSVTLKRASAKVSGHTCRIGAGTALAALLRTPLVVRLRDYGSCSKRPIDAGGLYVRGVSGEREKGADGWVYKIDNEAPSLGAADLSGKVRAGQRVLWFWCVSAGTGCQRTLTVKPERTAVAAGDALRVIVKAYDNVGKGVAADGATVTMGSATAVAGPDGVATVTVPPGSATLDVVATQAKRVRSFPVEVTVG